MVRAVYEWPHKFIVSSSGKREYYDLSADHGEDRDLWLSERPAAQQLGLEMAAWLKTIPAQARQRMKLDGEALQRLKSLGYVQ
jgi:hypothetical protein